MFETLGTIDSTVFIGYIVAMMAIGVWIAYRNKAKNSKDYFLADKSLPWWAVGGSLIASNISAEQMIGMAGSGFAIGLAISSYELMAAATLLIVAKFFLPIYLKNDIYTMPQFLEKRFGTSIKTILAVMWIMLLIGVNITSLLYLGALAMETIMGVPLMVGIIGLAIYSATFSIFGGLRAVVWTDVIQVVVLILGGTIASIAILNAVGNGSGIFAGIQTLIAEVPEKFDMIFEKDTMYTDVATGESKSAYDLLPGISILIGGMWIANLYYWGTNQYIIQRALAAKNIREAQKGVAFAAVIKLFIPLIVVIPGIAAFYLGADITKADQAYPWVLNNFVGTGFKGIAIAALVAAIGSSLSSMLNSTSTMFTLDIYKPLFNKEANENKLVKVGQVAASVALVLGILIAPALASAEQMFNYIQEYTGFLSPGILAVFMFGMFWKKTTTNAAFVSMIVSFITSIVLKVYFAYIPFIDRMGIVFIISALLLVAISLAMPENKENQKTVVTEKGMFDTSMTFNVTSLFVVIVLAIIYIAYW